MRVSEFYISPDKLSSSQGKKMWVMTSPLGEGEMLPAARHTDSGKLLVCPNETESGQRLFLLPVGEGQDEGECITHESLRFP
jgi:hypothetical protein